jgi:hypothetical protein
VYHPPDSPVTLIDPQVSHSDVPTPYLLMTDFSLQPHLWGSMDEDKRVHILRDPPDLTLWYEIWVSPHTSHLAHSCLDLAIRNPAVSSHLMWTLQDDLCRSDTSESVTPYIQLPFSSRISQLSA